MLKEERNFIRILPKYKVYRKMSVTKSRKYFGEKPLDGPVPFGSMYKKSTSNNENKPLYYDNKNSNKYFYYPSPEELAEYERISSGSSSHIIALLGKEQIHRQRMYLKSQNSKTWTERLKNILGATCVLANIAAVVYLSLKDYQIIAIFMSVALLFSIKLFYSNVFVTQKNHPVNNRFKKNNRRHRQFKSS